MVGGWVGGEDASAASVEMMKLRPKRPPSRTPRMEMLHAWSMALDLPCPQWTLGSVVQFCQLHPCCRLLFFAVLFFQRVLMFQETLAKSRDEAPDLSDFTGHITIRTIHSTAAAVDFHEKLP